MRIILRLFDQNTVQDKVLVPQKDRSLIVAQSLNALLQDGYFFRPVEGEHTKCLRQCDHRKEYDILNNFCIGEANTQADVMLQEGGYLTKERIDAFLKAHESNKEESKEKQATSDVKEKKKKKSNKGSLPPTGGPTGRELV